MTFLFLLLAISLTRLRGMEISSFPFGKFIPYKSNNYSRYTCNTQADVDRDCRCDKDCMEYGECCIDHFSRMSSRYIEKYLAFFEREFDRARNRLDCEKFETKLPDGATGYKFYFMKSTCLDGTASELEKKCTDNDGELPVLVSGNSFLYKNMFCAQCNLEFKFVKINYTIMCEGKFE